MRAKSSIEDLFATTVNDQFWGNKGALFGGNYNFWVINDHFGGTSVHCGQILQKNPDKGQSLPPFWHCQYFGNIWSPNPSLSNRMFSTWYIITLMSVESTKDFVADDIF